ncbi:MAG: recombination mediator RecR [Rickettsiales bacterium]|jgi:recombination protein RecR|nr:recombination mediator RecR [Rickettsiales bacterium]
MDDKILKELIKIFSKLPSLGPRSAKRLVLYLLNNKENIMLPLISCLEESYKVIRKCHICGNLTSDEICEICDDKTRNNGILCVVESVADLWAIENTGFNGLYHLLNGNLSASEGRTPDNLNLDNLIDRIKKNEIKEVIIATNPTIEGQTTAFYIVDLLKDIGVKITQPALGIPLGSEFNYIDESTLGIAFKNKKEL